MTIKALYPTVRPTLNLDFAKTKALDPRVTFTRIMTGASVATYVGADVLIKTAGNNVPRFDHNPTTGESLGLLVEEARTNLATYSEQFDNAAWVKNQTTMTANATTAPDGTLTADKMVANSSNAFHYGTRNISVSASTIYTYSIYAKKGEYDTCFINFPNDSSLSTFNLTNGTVISTPGGVIAAIQNVGNGWYRLACTHTTSAGTTAVSSFFGLGTGSFLGDGTSGIFIWGAQLEAGSFATSYIPTTTATVTRAADVASMMGTNFSSWYNQSAGTLFTEYDLIGDSGSACFILGLTTDTVLNGYGIQIDSASGPVKIYNANSGTRPTLGNNRGPNLKSKVAMVISSVHGGSLNGATPVTTSSTIYTGLTNLRLGTLPGVGATSAQFGHIARLAYYPVRLPDAQLQALTAT
jgi:hypothetical protein